MTKTQDGFYTYANAYLWITELKEQLLASDYETSLAAMNKLQTSELKTLIRNALNNLQKNLLKDNLDNDPEPEIKSFFQKFFKKENVVGIVSLKTSNQLVTNKSCRDLINQIEDIIYPKKIQSDNSFERVERRKLLSKIPDLINPMRDLSEVFFEHKSQFFSEFLNENYIYDNFDVYKASCLIVNENLEFSDSMFDTEINTLGTVFLLYFSQKNSQLYLGNLGAKKIVDYYYSFCQYLKRENFSKTKTKSQWINLVQDFFVALGMNEFSGVEPSERFGRNEIEIFKKNDLNIQEKLTKNESLTKDELNDLAKIRVSGFKFKSIEIFDEAKNSYPVFKVKENESSKSSVTPKIQDTSHSTEYESIFLTEHFDDSSDISHFSSTDINHISSDIDDDMECQLNLEDFEEFSNSLLLDNTLSSNEDINNEN